MMRFQKYGIVVQWCVKMVAQVFVGIFTQLTKIKGFESIFKENC